MCDCIGHICLFVDKVAKMKWERINMQKNEKETIT